MTLRLHLLPLVLLCTILNIQNAFTDVPIRSFGTYTAAERKALDKLRNEVLPGLPHNYMKTDQYLIRWLRIEDLDLQRAKAKLANMLKWRRDNNIDGILDQDFTRQLRLCPYDTSGTDRNGRPVITVTVGGCNLRRLSLTGEFDVVKRVIYYIAEKTTKRIHDSQAKGHNLTDLIGIGSGIGFNLREHMCLTCLPGITEALAVYENYYPEYVYKIIAINVPRIANVLLTFVEPLLSERSQNRLKIYGFDKKEWQAEVLKLIAPEELEPAYGGTKLATIHTLPPSSNKLH